jgi:hypothetical protein
MTSKFVMSSFDITLYIHCIGLWPLLLQLTSSAVLLLKVTPCYSSFLQEFTVTSSSRNYSLLSASNVNFRLQSHY